MVHHIVLWNLKETLSDAEKKEAASRIKTELEALKGQIPGIISLQVMTEGLQSANRDLGLISAYESEDALKAYQVHPAHVAASSYVHSVTCDRICFDYAE